MHFKNSLKPTKGKIVLFLVVLMLVALFSIFPGGEWIGYGFPMLYAEHSFGRIPDGGFYSDWQINYVGLLVDLIFWYLVTCGMIALYMKIKKKKLPDTKE